MIDKRSLPLAHKIRTLRHATGLKQCEVAERMGYNKQTISHWENGDFEPCLSALLDLCDFYGITPNELLEWEET